MKGNTLPWGESSSHLHCRGETAPQLSLFLSTGEKHKHTATPTSLHSLCLKGSLGERTSILPNLRMAKQRLPETLPTSRFLLNYSTFTDLNVYVFSNKKKYRVSQKRSQIFSPRCRNWRNVLPLHKINKILSLKLKFNIFHPPIEKNYYKIPKNQ